MKNKGGSPVTVFITFILLIIVILAIFFLVGVEIPLTGSTVTGTAGIGSNFGLVALVIGVVVLLIIILIIKNK